MTSNEPASEPAGDDRPPAVDQSDRKPPGVAKPSRAGWPVPRPVVLVAIVLALVFGGWGLWRTVSPASTDVRTRLSASEQAHEQLQARFDDLKQQVATLGRSDQISRDANRDLQGTLSERDEEIAGLRADVAFYERLVGATSQRRGLTVHALKMEPQNGNAWQFQATLTQNLNRGAVSSGHLSLSIEGSRDGKLQTLDWDSLRQHEKAEPVAFSFKYFQQVKGDVFLPEGFSPVRVTVRLQPRSGAAIAQSFSWVEVTAANPTSATAPAATALE